MKHELKIWPQFYEAVVKGTKTFEYRKNDRFFQPGDFVVLKEFDPSPHFDRYAGEGVIGFTDRENLIFKIGYVYPACDNHVIFSLIPTKEVPL